jgi:hypothetical protein
MEEQAKESWASSLLNVIGPSEAEASPIGKVFKSVARPLLKKGTKSSTVKELVGQPFKGETIKNIVKGRGDWRYILTEEGNTHPVTKDVLHDMERALGTTLKMVEFSGKEVESQLVQAYKSLAYHEARMNPFATRKAVEDHFKYYSKNIAAGKQDMPDTCLILYNEKSFTMPTEYATILEKEGAIKILKKLR